MIVNKWLSRIQTILVAAIVVLQVLIVIGTIFGIFAKNTMLPWLAFGLLVVLLACVLFISGRIVHQLRKHREHFLR